MNQPTESAKSDSIFTGCRALFELLGRSRKEYLARLLAASALSCAEGILHPLLVKAIFNEVVNRRGFHHFFTLILSYLALGLLLNLGNAVTSFWGKSLENRVVLTVTRQLLEAYYRGEYGEVLRRGYGYFICRIYGDVRDGLIPLLSLIQTTLSQVVLLASLSLVLVYLSWEAFLILAALIPLSGVVGALLGKQMKALASQEREQEGDVLAILTKALSAFRMVRGFKLFSRTVHGFDEKMKLFLSTSYQKYRAARIFQAINDFTMVISDFLSLFVGALLVLKGALTFGAYLAFVNSFWRAVNTLMQLLKGVPDFHNFGVAIMRMKIFLASSIVKYHQTSSLLSASNLRFSYGSGFVLKDFSLQLTRGERIVLVGPNGCGKTTLANILSGYLAPTHGSVSLPETIGSVTLPISFPPLKVKDLPCDAYIRHTFSLSDQGLLETFADELSAGQQQKLAISLALSQDADLYIIDEPLANLDPESKVIAINLMLQKTEGKTLIVVMHGSEQFHHLFDRVVRIDRVTENGTDEEQAAVHAI